MSSRTAALLGTGLIGSSIGVALRAAGFTVVAWDRDPTHLEGASGIGAFDRSASSQSEALEDADVVVLAVPAEATVEILAALETDSLVIDVAGVKAPIAAAGTHLPHFVATHPMAGSETSGPEAASGSLFRGATWVIVTDHASADDLDAVTAIVEAFGAVPVRMTAAEHDIAVALASHLPHLTASALVETVAADPDALSVAAGGFRDLTRIAASKAPWWPDVLVENRLAVIDALEALSDRLSSIADELRSGERDAISRRLNATADIRRSMAAPVVGVRLVLEDRPGQMALVGAALSSSSVDLRDLQLRHATHGGGGVLTLSVRPDEADRLAEALRLQGFTLLD
ncbi:MAG: prephenate dehydrogenase/arogenate dehydrogenase family protein [Acidimicrobiia bacterium]|nr:prephenate dehydrogenase/arogenate dehydrogenase family protein [Acidimicrobiia bacterium]